MSEFNKHINNTIIECSNSDSNSNSYSDSNSDSNSDFNSDSNSDTDKYIDLSSYVEDDLKNIFQFQPNDDKLIIKYIGKSSDTPDIIIMENFGSKSNTSLYNCVYSYDELESIKNIELEQDNKDLIQSNKDNQCDNLEQLKLFFPIIKLITNEKDNIITSSIAIKLEQDIIYDDDIIKWKLYWVENSQKSDYIKTLEIKKNINPSNIIEKIIYYSLENNK